jgi:hypothetical protein
MESPTLIIEPVAFKHMQTIIQENLPRPRYNPNAAGDRIHVIHCFHQLWRFAHLALHGHDFRAVQFGMNLGRAQEILGSAGGVECWWRLYEPILKDYDRLIEITKRYLELLELPLPDDATINKI